MSEEEKINSIYEMCKDMKAVQEKQGIRIARIDRELKGDKDYDSEGLIQRVKRHGDYIQKQKLKAAKQTGLIAGISILFTVIIELIKLYSK